MFESVKAGVEAPIDAVVLGLWEGQLPGAAEPGEVHEAAHRGEFGAKTGDLAEAFPAGFPRHILVRLGARGDREAFRKGMASAARRLASCKAKSVQIRFDGGDQDRALGRVAGEAFGMLAWSAGSLKSEPETLPTVRIESPDEEQMKGIAEGVGIAEAVNYARTLAWTPPSIATPEWMSAQARRLASELGLEFRVYAGEELLRERLTGIATVGGASENPPCFIRLEYNPGGSDEAPIVLVGKTITYDTGGLSIKGKTGMPGMKGDKGGGCAVLGAMKAIAETLKPNRRVVALLTAAENSISGAAYRPDDVMTFRDGTTVEVTNTDAEGRLVLADGLIWAREVEGAAGVADIATLTGGVVTALGKVMAGIFSNSDSLAEAAALAGTKTGDRVWRLPLDPEYKELMKSPIADILNSNLNGQAHPVQGATFLAHFVPDDLPWLHVDMAGMMEKAAGGPWVQGPSGFGVRLLSELVMTWPGTTD